MLPVFRKIGRRLLSQHHLAIYLQATILYGDGYPFRDVGHIDPDSCLADRIWDRDNMVELGARFNALIGINILPTTGISPFWKTYCIVPGNCCGRYLKIIN